MSVFICAHSFCVTMQPATFIFSSDQCKQASEMSAVCSPGDVTLKVGSQDLDPRELMKTHDTAVSFVYRLLHKLLGK